MPSFSHFHALHGPEEKETKPHVGSTYLRLLGYARPYWGRVTVIIAISLIAAFLSTLPVQVIGSAVDEIRSFALDANHPSEATHAPASARPGPRPVELPVTAPIRKAAGWAHKHWFPWANRNTVTFGVMAVTFILLYAVSGLVAVVHQFMMAYVGQRLVYDMRGQVYAHLQHLSLSYFENQRTGDLMSRVVNDVNSLDHVIVGPVVGLMTDVFRLCWILYFCLTWDWRLTVMALLVAPLLVVLTWIFGRYIRRLFRELRTRIGELNAIANDNISGIRVIKGFCREEYEAERFQQKNESVYEQNLKLARLFAFVRPSIELVTNLGSAVVLFYGGYKVVKGQMNPGTFVVFFSYLGMLYGPITGLSRFWNFIQRAVASVERVFEVLDTQAQVVDAAHAIELPIVKGRVEFRNVCFAYQPGNEVLHDINLSARPGTMTAFVGPSGAGKTTLTSLIPRLYDPQEGRILIDDVDIRKIRLRSLRSHMAMVLQDPFLFNDTVKANIGYGKVGAMDEEIVSAAKAANAHDFIMELPNGYDTVVGERGVRLSGGQKQRISIARALLANPRILILDEATSSVDSETEALIQDAIFRLVKNRTTFVIAHRLSTVLHADMIVVMDKGRIVEVGTHEELLANGNLYAHLFRMQFKTSPERREPREDTGAPPSFEPQPMDDLSDDLSMPEL